MNRTLTQIAIGATSGLVLLTAACSGETGKALPSTTERTSSTASSTATSHAGDTKLAAIKPCDLLTEIEVAQLGLTNPGEPDKVGSSNGCDWKVSGNGGLTAGIRAKQGIKDLNIVGEKTSQTKFGTYNATKVEAPDGATSSCMVLIAVSDSSTVDIVANLKATSKDTAGACERATKAAELIAPKLP
jgi:hypothetical protein